MSDFSDFTWIRLDLLEHINLNRQSFDFR